MYEKSNFNFTVKADSKQSLNVVSNRGRSPVPTFNLPSSNMTPMKFLDVEREDSVGDGAKTVPYTKCKLLKNKSGV